MNSLFRLNNNAVFIQETTRTPLPSDTCNRRIPRTEILENHPRDSFPTSSIRKLRNETDQEIDLALLRRGCTGRRLCAGDGERVKKSEEETCRIETRALVSFLRSVRVGSKQFSV